MRVMLGTVCPNPVRFKRSMESNVTDLATQQDQTHHRAVIWIDHLTAKIFSMGITGVSSHVVRAHLTSEHLYHQANSVRSGHVLEDPNFLSQIADAVEACGELLITGPGVEKTALLHYLHNARPGLLVRLEACDHPSDAEIIALGRKHFRLE